MLVTICQSVKAAAWGAAVVKPGKWMDTYSQWAAIGNAPEPGPDGTVGRSANAIRHYVFGSHAQNLTGWAQGTKDAMEAAFIASRT